MKGNDEIPCLEELIPPSAEVALFQLMCSSPAMPFYPQLYYLKKLLPDYASWWHPFGKKQTIIQEGLTPAGDYSRGDEVERMDSFLKLSGLD
ncbi:hypothetical protein CEXT_807021 [Caerostris extrusa]|uniref:Uncharacterized protein n=1 Tax=Caerostris extrusa TaxID=172846 RepID=A0AAV4QNY7_CAEEX|nr:hypothetical protein CEXT_807021 [Caerostris extrusa]